MRLPRARFTVRQIMIAVGVLAVGLSVLLTCRRHAEYRRRFDEYDHESNFWRKIFWLNEKRVEVLTRRGVWNRPAAAEAAAITEELRKFRPAAEHAEQLR